MSLFRMHESSDMFELAERYFRQQSELYGSEFYVNWPVGRKAVLQSGLKLELCSETIHDLEAKVKTCTACKLANTRTQVVFGTGSTTAELMCIGEAPGHDEDKAGEPFVGKAGQLLNKILDAIGFKREEVYIANIVKCRPPNNRDPLPEESKQCLPYLRQQIHFVNPKIILILGRVAAHNLLNTDESLSSLRQHIHDFEGRKVFVTYHPAALLRNQQWKHHTWNDVKKLRAFYDTLVGDKPPLKGKQK